MGAGRYDRWVEPDPKQFKVWRTAWDLLLTDRYTLAEICEELHRRGYTFRSGRAFVTVDENGKITHAKNNLSRIFKNWFYAGWYVSEVKDIEPKVQRGEWEPVVTTEEFERGLEILEARNKKRSSVRRQQYLLTRLIHVRYDDQIHRLSCSTPNASRSGGGTSYYRSVKLGIRIMCRTVDDQIPGILRMIEVDPDTVPLMQEYFKQNLDHKDRSQQDDFTRIEQELARVKQQHNNAYHEYVNEFVTQEQWREMSANLNQRRKTLENELENLGRDREVILHDLDTALTILHQLSQLYVRLDIEQQRELLSHVVKQLIVNEQGEIEEVVLQPPFMYIYTIHEAVKKRLANREIKNTTLNEGGVRDIQCSEYVPRCSEGGTCSEQIPPKSTLVASPQNTQFPHKPQLLTLLQQHQ